MNNINYFLFPVKRHLNSHEFCECCLIVKFTDLANKRNAQKTQNLLNKANLKANSLILTPPVVDPRGGIGGPFPTMGFRALAAPLNLYGIIL